MEYSSEQVKVYLRRFLIEMSLIRYCFDTRFTLQFIIHGERTDDRLPGVIVIYFSSDWWFGERECWIERVESNGAGVQPNEPLLAFELAQLRWSIGNKIVNVEFENEFVSLIFENGTIINSRYPDNGDEFFICIDEYDAPIGDETWFEATKGEVYMRVPA